MPFKYEPFGALTNLVPSESPASGRHGFAMWRHDAKITKIGVISRGSSPGQGTSNDSHYRTQDPRPISKCTTSN